MNIRWNQALSPLRGSLQIIMTGVCLKDSKKVPQKYQNYKHTYPKKYLKCKKYTQNSTQNAKKYTQKYCFTKYTPKNTMPQIKLF